MRDERAEIWGGVGEAVRRKACRERWEFFSLVLNRCVLWATGFGFQNASKYDSAGRVR